MALASDEMDAEPTGAELVRDALSRKDLAAARQRIALARLLALAETDVLAIQHLARDGQLTASRLARLLGLSSGGATALVQRLERAGCVVREPHPSDRRSTLLRLTPELQARASAPLAPLVSELDAIVAALPEGEAAVVERFLREVADAAERHAEALAQRSSPRVAAPVVNPVRTLWA